jgi:hypothetical protein
MLNWREQAITGSLTADYARLSGLLLKKAAVSDFLLSPAMRHRYTGRVIGTDPLVQTKSHSIAHRG